MTPLYIHHCKNQAYNVVWCFINNIQSIDILFCSKLAYMQINGYVTYNQMAGSAYVFLWICKVLMKLKSIVKCCAPCFVAIAINVYK